MIIILMNDNFIYLFYYNTQIRTLSKFLKHPVNWDDRRSCENILKHDTHSKHHLELFSQKQKIPDIWGQNSTPSLLYEQFPPFFYFIHLNFTKKTYLCGCTRRNIFVLHDSCAETISFRLDFTKPFTPTPRVGSASPDGM